MGSKPLDATRWIRPDSGSLLFFAHRLEARTVTGWSRLAAGGAIVSLAVAAALQAVDGIDLRTMVDTWAAAPVAQRPVAFQAAFAVRQVEVGLAARARVTNRLMFV